MRLQKDQLVRLLREMTERGATELHLKTHVAPLYRVDGQLVRTDARPLTHHDTQAAAFTFCAMAGKKGPSPQDTEVDFSLEGCGRFRVFLFKQQGSITAVVHVLEQTIPSLADLDVRLSLPMLLAEGGLWVICGRQRSLLLAALVQEQTLHHPGHTVVLQEEAGLPFRDGAGIVSVRRIGVDIPDLASGVRTGRRMGADLLVTSDLRDAAAAAEVLEAVESGLPVITSIGFARAADCAAGVARLFEPERRDVILHRVEDVLRQTVAYPVPALEIARARRTSEDPPPLPRALIEG
jgi:twitching motility protein PilT